MKWTAELLNAASSHCRNMTPGDPLTVMSLNMQYYSSYPEDVQLGRQCLQELILPDPAPDIICVQEGLEGRNEICLAATDYRRLVSSAGQETSGSELAQTVEEMVYSDADALRAVVGTVREKLLVNELYLKVDSNWEVLNTGVHQVSSNVELDGSDGRVAGPLAVRTVVWAELRPRSSMTLRSSVFVLNMHLSGGRFEDQFFVQYLSAERRMQVERAIGLFKRLSKSRHDLGILVGDFNATEEYVAKGPMQNYFMAAIAKSQGVQADASAQSLSSDELEKLFKEYLIAPFTALSASGWHLAYTEEQVGATSAFGHLIDHMATSREIPSVAQRLIATNQKFPPSNDTEVPITDHNAVKTTFAAPLALSRSSRCIQYLCSCCSGCFSGIRRGQRPPQGSDEDQETMSHRVARIRARSAVPGTLRRVADTLEASKQYLLPDNPGHG